MKNILLPIFLFICITTNAQVKGKAIDAATKKPVEFASVTLLAIADSSIVRGGLTDTTGFFEIPNVEAGKYFIAVSSLEYKKFMTDPFEITSEKKSLDLGLLSLTTDQTLLKEVVIKGSRPVFEQKLGKTIINVDSKMFKTAGNAIDILKRSPGLIVDMNGGITFRGTSPKLLFDGRDLRMSAEQEKNYLRTLTPDMIESIELMANPPAKYESAFLTVVNIVLKRDKNLGTKGSVYGYFMQHRFSNGEVGGNLTYKTKKMAYTLNATASDNTYYQLLSDTRIVGREGAKDVFESASDIIMPTKNLNYTAGAEYTINAKNTIDFKLTGDHSTGPGYTSATNKSTINGKVGPLATSTNQMTDLGLSLTGLLGYKYKNEKGKEFIVELAMADNNRPATQDLITEFTNNGIKARPILRQRNTQLATSSFKTINVNYTDVLFKKWQFETGFKINAVKNTASIAFDTLAKDVARDAAVTNADFNNDKSRTNNFMFDENINMGFIQFSRQYTKLGIQAGLRVENTRTNGRSLTLDSVVNRNYYNWLPTLTLNYKIDDNNNLAFGATRKLRRPGVWELNPFKFFIDPFTVAIGNPFLFPTIRNNLDLTYTHKSTMVTLSHSLSQNAVNQLPIYDQKLKQMAWTQVNITRQNTFLDITHSGKFTEKWNYTLFTDITYGLEKYNANGKQITTKGWNGTIWGQNMFSLPKGFNVELTGYYLIPTTSGFYKIKSMGAVNAGLQKSFQGGVWNLQVNVNDIFWMSKARMTLNVGETNIKVLNIQPTRNASIRLTYNFGKSTFKSQGRKSGVAEDAARIKK